MEVVVADSFLQASSRCSTTVGRGPGSSLATSPPAPARLRVLHLDLASREIQPQVGPGQASGASQVLHTNPSLHSSSSQARTLSRTASKRGSSPAPARPSLVRPRARGSTRSRGYNLGPQLNNNSMQFRLHSRLISSSNNSSNSSSSRSSRRPRLHQFSNNNKCNTNLQKQCSRCNHKLQLQMQSSFNKHKYTSNSSNFNNNNFSNNSYSYNNNNNNNI